MAARLGQSVNCKSILCDVKVVPTSALHTFASILMFIPEESHENYDARQRYIQRTKPLIKSLHFPLSRPDPVTRKILLPKQSDYAQLCNMHISLNSDFVHQWFLLISLEVGSRMDALTSARPEKIPEMMFQHQIVPLRRLHKLWLSPSEFERKFGSYSNDSLSDQAQYCYQENKCEACILSRIGASLDLVMGLFCVVQSRFSYRYHNAGRRQPRLKRLLSEWMNVHRKLFEKAGNVEVFEFCMSTNDERARTLYSIRKALHRENRRSNRHKTSQQSLESENLDRHTSSLLCGQDEEVNGDDIRDAPHQAEIDIIDCYAAMDLLPRPGEDLYQQATDSGSLERSGNPELPYCDLGQFIRSQLHDGKRKPLTLMGARYNESRYSVNTMSNNHRVVQEYFESENPPQLKCNMVSSYEPYISSQSDWHPLSQPFQESKNSEYFRNGNNCQQIQFGLSRRNHHNEALRILESKKDELESRLSKPFDQPNLPSSFYELDENLPPTPAMTNGSSASNSSCMDDSGETNGPSTMLSQVSSWTSQNEATSYQELQAHASRWKLSNERKI